MSVDHSECTVNFTISFDLLWPYSNWVLFISSHLAYMLDIHGIRSSKPYMPLSKSEINSVYCTGHTHQRLEAAFCFCWAIVSLSHCSGASHWKTISQHLKIIAVSNRQIDWLIVWLITSLIKQLIIWLPNDINQSKNRSIPTVIRVHPSIKLFYPNWAPDTFSLHLIIGCNIWYIKLNSNKFTLLTNRV